MKRLSTLAVLAALLCAALCVSPAAAQNSGKPDVPPLEFDPAKPEKVEGWWSNGTELLLLEPNGAYAMWITQDRFARPAEIGAWRRSNYILFDLEPYRAKPGTRVRVQLVKDRGETRIAREGMANFKRLAAPPRVFADEVLGVWTADREQLVLLENGRYEYRRTGVTSGISQHDGIWRTEGTSVFLAPDTGAVDPIRLNSEKQPDGTLLLRGPGGTLKHWVPEQPAPAAPTAAPDVKPTAPSTAPSAAPGNTPATPAAPAGNPPASTQPAGPAKSGLR